MLPYNIKIFISLCVNLVIFSASVSLRGDTFTKTRVKETVNVYPMTDIMKITSVDRYTELAPLDSEYNRLHVKLDDKEDWLLKSLIEPQNYESVVITTDETSIRRDAAAEYNQFQLFAKCKTFPMIEKGETLYQLTLANGNSGWILKDDSKKAVQKNIVLIKNAVVRKEPDENSQKIVKVSKGTELLQLDKAGSWYLVKVTDDLKGWLQENNIKIVTANNITVFKEAHIRRGPNKMYGTIETVPANTRLTEIEKKKEWYKVRTPNGKTGWVHKDYVGEKSYAIQKYVVPTQFLITTQDCNIRQGYSTNFKILRRVQKGSILVKFGAKDDWFRVKFPPNGRIGWIKADLVDDNVEILLTNRDCNIRQGYNTTFPVIRKVKAGTPLAKIGSRDDWYRVHLPDGIIGWIKSDLSTNVSDVFFTNQKSNVLDGPSSDFTKIGELKSGTIVVKSKLKGEWYKIKLPGKTNDGWIKKDMLSTVFEYVETKDNTNIREGPGTNNPIFKKVSKNTALFKVGQQDDWLEVRLLGGGKGWVRQELITPFYLGKPDDRSTSTVSVTSETSTDSSPSISTTSLTTIQQTNIRIGTGLDYAILTRVETGTKLIKVATHGDWYEVILPDKTVGYVHYSVFSKDGIAPEKGKLYTIRASNVRSDPDSTSKRITRLASGTVVSKLDQKENWTYVKLKSGIIGWIFSPLLASRTTEIKPVDVTVEYGFLKTVNDFNIRSGPGETYKIITKIPEDQQLKKIGSHKNWYKVQLNDKQSGWIRDDIVENVIVGKLITISPTEVKEKADSKSRVLEKLSTGTVLNPGEKVGDWFAITTPSRQGGWVNFENVNKLSYPIVYAKDKSKVLQTASEDAPILTILDECDELEPLAEDGYWLFVKLPDGSKGWILESMVFNQLFPKIKIIKDAKAYVNPTSNSKIISILMKGDEFQSLLKQDEWYKITLRGGGFGWVYSSYCDIVFCGNIVITKPTNVREGPGLEYKIITTVKEGQEFNCYAEEKSWVKILSPNGEVGWIRKEVSGESFYEAVITARPTEVRSGPGNHYELLTTLNSNIKITPIDEQNNWYKYNYSPSQKGWVRKSDFVNWTKSAIVFTLERCYIRNGPGENYKVIKQIEPATDLNVIGENRDWYKVKLMNANIEGWISKDMVFE